jgi:hypothetical protein
MNKHDLSFIVPILSVKAKGIAGQPRLLPNLLLF